MKLGQPSTYSPLIQSGPLAYVSPNSTDVFYVAAAALMGIIYQGCGERLQLLDESPDRSCCKQTCGGQLDRRHLSDTWQADENLGSGLWYALFAPFG
jgi:hypothetical protein